MQMNFSLWPSQQISHIDAATNMDMMVSMDLDMDPDGSEGLAAQPRDANWIAGPGPALNHLHDSRPQVLRPISMDDNDNHDNNDHGDDAAMADTIPRGMQSDMEWHDLQNRRLPSPISEPDRSSSSIGDMGFRSPDMILDSGFPGQRPVWASAVDHLQHQHMQRGDGTWAIDGSDVDSNPPSAQSPPPTAAQQHHHRHHIVHHNTSSSSSSSRSSSSSWHPAIELTVTASLTDDRTSPQSPSSGRKGHARSRHTLSSPLGPAPALPALVQAKTFSIGYRADCEKCRKGVPGHFNHFIIS